MVMSKLSQTESGLLIVEEEKDPRDRPRKTISIYHLTTTYGNEVEKFTKAINKGGGKFIACLVVGYYNAWGDKMGKQYAVFYQAEKELSIEQWT